MQEFKLKDLLEIHNGKDYKLLNKGTIPVYGTGGVITYIDQFLYDNEAILLPRKGSLDNIMYVDSPFWTVDTMYWATIRTDIAYCKYVYLYLSLLDLSHKDTGSTLPSMTYDVYYDIPIILPDFDTQKKIADSIFQLNMKIETNNRINDNLYA